jgi:predicted lipid-binding transport protein (Tim44 family)
MRRSNLFPEYAMKKLFSVFVVLFGLTLIGIEAEAKRLGGGKSMGAQRDMTQQQATPKAPAQQQQSQQAAGAPAQQPAAATGNKWLGPLAGLAMGAGLMALFMNNGIAGAFAGLLLAAAIAGVLVLAFRALRGRSAQAPMQYAGHAGRAAEPLAAGGGAAPHAVAATAGRWPADFNAAEFLRHARLNFVRLQEAHDARDSAALTDFLAADLLAEVQAQWQTEGPTNGKTDVVTLESEVLEVVTEGLLYVVSVRFSGLIREDGAAEPQPFAEIWHLEKPMRGSTGWLVSGIQQA